MKWSEGKKRISGNGVGSCKEMTKRFFFFLKRRVLRTGVEWSGVG